jgi:hypothetical protein
LQAFEILTPKKAAARVADLRGWVRLQAAVADRGATV